MSESEVTAIQGRQTDIMERIERVSNLFRFVWWVIAGIVVGGAVLGFSWSKVLSDAADTKADVVRLRAELQDHRTQVIKIQSDVNEIKVTSARSEGKLDLLLQGKR